MRWRPAGRSGAGGRAMTSPRVLTGDCRTVLTDIATASVDACITDPPYHLTQASRGGSARVAGTGPFGRHRVGEKGFMGKTWDGGGVAFTAELWAEVLRVLTAGSYLLAFGGTRTYHRLTCAIEDAGFEICDCLSWLYGSGFPKHASKLKPAWEPIVMARKPARKATLLNIDACRLSGDGLHEVTQGAEDRIYGGGRGLRSEPSRYAVPAGRWPANVALDEEAAAALDEQSGELTSNSGNLAKYEGRQVNTYGTYAERSDKGRSDTGGASRFFYTAKASRSEREQGLEGAARKPGGSNAKGFTDDVARGLDRNRAVANHHPTVKPVDLMRWLVRLVTPPNGLVLDPFTGSGTTGVAAVLEDRRFVGIEREPEYVAIAEARIRRAAEQGSLFREIA